MGFYNVVIYEGERFVRTDKETWFLRSRTLGRRVDYQNSQVSEQMAKGDKA